MQIDDIADQLYGLPPEEFTAARDQAAKDATEPDARKTIKALRKPTVGAHAVNLLVRQRTDDVDRLLALGDEMRTAMGGDPGEVRRLTAERRELIGELVDPDLPASVQQDVTATLEAATADPDLGAAVRSGRLVKPLRYAGFGTMPDLADVVATPLRPVTRKASPSVGGKAAPVKKPSSKARAKAAPQPAKRPPAAPPQPSPDLAAARQRCLDLAGEADNAQRRYELAVKAAAEARHLLEAAEAERADAHKAARAAHAAAEKARREVGRLERS